MVAYGSGHTVTIDGTVTASGQDGRAVALDFGSSSNGAVDEYRGSYIRFRRNVDETSGKISYSNNLFITDMDSATYNNNAEELNGALLKELNVNGTIAGGESAIYIGKNAFVDTININDGASIKGAITSEWKQFAEGGAPTMRQALATRR